MWATILTIVLASLKAFGYTDLSWWIVFAPVIALFVFALLMYVAAILFLKGD